MRTYKQEKYCYSHKKKVIIDFLFKMILSEGGTKE